MANQIIDLSPDPQQFRDTGAAIGQILGAFGALERKRQDIQLQQQVGQILTDDTITDPQQKMDAITARVNSFRPEFGGGIGGMAQRVGNAVAPRSRLQQGLQDFGINQLGRDVTAQRQENVRQNRRAESLEDKREFEIFRAELFGDDAKVAKARSMSTQSAPQSTRPTPAPTPTTQPSAKTKMPITQEFLQASSALSPEDVVARKKNLTDAVNLVKLGNDVEKIRTRLVEVMGEDAGRALNELLGIEQPPKQRTFTGL